MYLAGLPIENGSHSAPMQWYQVGVRHIIVHDLTKSISGRLPSLLPDRIDRIMYI